MSDYTNTYLIEGTNYAIHTSLDEMRMSHWVNRFYIANQYTQEVVLDFRVQPCDYMEHQWVGHQLLVCYRVYPNGNDKQEMLIDFEEESLIYKEVSYAFKDLEKVLCNHLEQSNI